MDASFCGDDMMDFSNALGGASGLDDMQDEDQDEHLVKKLVNSFDEEAAIAASIPTKISNDNQTGMKVYLRVRPNSSKTETTMRVTSSNSIVTMAPDTSKRAQYTKLEERHYVILINIKFLLFY